MKKILIFTAVLVALMLELKAQTKKQVPKYDTIIRKHVTKPVAKAEIVIPTPEFINQPYYYNKNDNRLIKLEVASAKLITKKKTLGLKRAKQIFRKYQNSRIATAVIKRKNQPKSKNKPLL